MYEDSFPEYTDIVIDVYDLDAFIASETDGQFESHDFGQGAAIIVRSDGSGCMLDYEAVGYAFNSIDDEVEIGIHKISTPDENGNFTISVIATHMVRCTYREIIEKAPVTQMTVDEFFTKRNYNSRCSRNFANITEYFE